MQVGFNSTGKLTALDIDVYSNGGYSMDYSISVCNSPNICMFTDIQMDIRCYCSHGNKKNLRLRQS